VFADLALDPLPVWIARACIAALLAHAALVKLSDRDLLEQHLAAYGAPPALLPLGARLLPALELLAAVALLTLWREPGAALAIALLSGYAAAMAAHRARGHQIDCGCGGEPLPVSWVLVARNALLAAIAALAGAPLHSRAMGLADFMVVVASVLLAALLYAALHQVLRASLRGRPESRRMGWTR
jgi:Methylamine utilisation protein MauE